MVYPNIKEVKMKKECVIENNKVVKTANSNRKARCESDRKRFGIYEDDLGEERRTSVFFPHVIVNKEGTVWFRSKVRPNGTYGRSSYWGYGRVKSKQISKLETKQVYWNNAKQKFLWIENADYSKYDIKVDRRELVYAAFNPVTYMLLRNSEEIKNGSSYLAFGWKYMDGYDGLSNIKVKLVRFNSKYREKTVTEEQEESHLDKMVGKNVESARRRGRHSSDVASLSAMVSFKEKLTMDEIVKVGLVDTKDWSLSDYHPENITDMISFDECTIVTSIDKEKQISNIADDKIKVKMLLRPSVILGKEDDGVEGNHCIVGFSTKDAHNDILTSDEFNQVRWTTAKNLLTNRRATLDSLRLDSLLLGASGLSSKHIVKAHVRQLGYCPYTDSVCQPIFKELEREIDIDKLDVKEVFRKRYQHCIALRKRFLLTSPKLRKRIGTLKTKDCLVFVGEITDVETKAITTMVNGHSASNLCKRLNISGSIYMSISDTVVKKDPIYLRMEGEGYVIGLKGHTHYLKIHLISTTEAMSKLDEELPTILP